MKVTLFLTVLTLTFANASFAGGCTQEQFDAGGKLKDVTLPSGEVVTICVFPKSKGGMIFCSGNAKPECGSKARLQRISDEDDSESAEFGEQEI